MVGLASVTAIGVVIEYRIGYNVFHDWIGHLLPAVAAGGHRASSTRSGASRSSARACIRWRWR